VDYVRCALKAVRLKLHHLSRFPLSVVAMANSQPQPIAIVGMSCRLPGHVESLGDFWKLLCRARSGWSKVPVDRFNAEAYCHPNPDKKGCFNSKGGYFLQQNLSMFDAGFFDITKKEAESMGM
jgi:acyl transferase domain-containing protein